MTPFTNIFTAKTLIVSSLAATILTVAMPSYAQSNSFNKFPDASISNSEKTIQSVKFSPADDSRIKRIIEPVSQKRRALSYAKDKGTKNLEKGFNKMNPNKVSSARPMRIIIDERAYSAR